MHLIPPQKQTQRGIAVHPPRVLQLALLNIDIIGKSTNSSLIEASINTGNRIIAGYMDLLSTQNKF